MTNSNRDETKYPCDPPNPRFLCPAAPALLTAPMNPYESSKTIVAFAGHDLSPEIIEHLIEGEGTEDLIFYDVSDYQLYGFKNRQLLTGELARRATEAGFDAIVYQSVLWWCFVFIPVIPRGTFAVIPKLDCDDPDGDADQYRGIRMEWDWRQIRLQYGIVAAMAILLGAIVYCWLFDRPSAQ